MGNNAGNNLSGFASQSAMQNADFPLALRQQGTPHCLNSFARTIATRNYTRARNVLTVVGIQALRGSSSDHNELYTVHESYARAAMATSCTIDFV